MLSLISKFPSVVPSVRDFVFRLYASTTKSSKFGNFTDAMKSKKNFALKPKREESKKIEAKPKSKASTQNTKKATKKPPLKTSSKPPAGKKPGDGKSCKRFAGKGSGDSTSSGAKMAPPSKPKPPSGYVPLDKCDIFEHHKTNSGFYRSISLTMVPVIAGLAGYIITHTTEPELHFVPYEYMYKHLKRFAWRDGRTTLFHGPNNFIPDEEKYEKQPDRWEIDLERRKQLRDQHAKEELERRKRRHNEEGPPKSATKAEQAMVEAEAKDADDGEGGQEGEVGQEADDIKTETQNGNEEAAEENSQSQTELKVEQENGK